MIRSPQQNAAQSHDVARDGKRDDLAAPIRQQLVTAGPAHLENEGLMPGLPLMGELLAPLHFDWVCLHIGEAFQLIRQQGDEGIHLFSTLTRATPAPTMPSISAAGRETSMTRPLANGPRSLIRTITCFAHLENSHTHTGAEAYGPMGTSKPIFVECLTRCSSLAPEVE
jgi:hypothetical protein